MAALLIYLQLELLLVFSIFASRGSLYTETGWQTLQNKRYAAKMITMFKIHISCAPPYLYDIIPANMKMCPVITREIKTNTLYLGVDYNFF